MSIRLVLELNTEFSAVVIASLIATGATFTETATTDGVKSYARAYLTYAPNGNKVEILNGASAVQATYYFYPLEECKYTPVIIDFVNKYGAWHREFFFKASTDNFNVENTEYNLMQTNSFSYSVTEGQRKVFNANGKKSIKVRDGRTGQTPNP